MGKVSLTTYTLVVFFLASSCYAELEEGISCSKHQTAFDGACYEFVGLQFSFLRAEGWCERGGGHLVFILNDETQQFLQTHLEPDKDWWLGLAPASPNLTLDVSPTEGKRMSEIFVEPYFVCIYILGFQILLPRLDVGEQNSTVLDLANFSTLMIDIPSPKVTLVLKLEPSQDISFMVFLGYKVYPHEKKNNVCHSDTVEKFTWLLSPKDRTGGAGIHFLLVKPIVEPGVKSVNATVTVTSIAAQCKYWNETKSSWSEDGCRVGPLTTPLVTQCLCNHLTFFGSSFFVMPNLVDVTRTAELFATFANNPVVVCFVGSIFAAYLLVVVWAHRKDIQDSTKVKITVLEDNDPLAEYRYMLTINTGHRHGASTSSQVTITLLGTEGESEPHHLTDPEKPVFERGGVDMFLLTTHFSLGDLQNIRLWHDNSGDHPAWYVNKVMVQDLETGQKWHFLCNSWLAVDMAECWLDKVFPVATESDLKRFSNLFFMKTAKDFQDGHIWFSVISRPPCSTFTRVQRVSCCFSLLLCTMLTSIMFWGIPTDPSEQTMDLGISIIMFPINLLIVSIFRNTRPRDKAAKPEGLKQGNTVRVSPSQTSSPPTEIKHITADTVIKTFDEAQKKANNSRYLYKQLRHVEKELRLLGPSRFPNTSSYNRAMQQVQGMKSHLEFLLDGDQLNRSPSPEESISSSAEKKRSQGGLPWWFVFVGWILVIATSAVSGYFTMMYGLTYGKDQSINWLISMVVSFFESLFITQPLKVSSKMQIKLKENTYFCLTKFSRMRKNVIQEQKVFGLIREILGRVSLMAAILRDPNAYFLSRHIRQSFSKGISNTMSIQDVFNWANTTLLSNLYGDYPGHFPVMELPTFHCVQRKCEPLLHCYADAGNHSHWLALQVQLKYCVWAADQELRLLCFYLDPGAFQFRSELHGVRLYQSTGGLHVFVMASEIAYFLFIIYYMFVQGKLMRSQKSSYFKIKWNLLELAIIILSWCALSVFIKRTLLGKRDISFYQNNKHQFASFHETAQADAALGYLIAFLVLLATIKLWHLLRLNPKLHMITATLQRAWTDISGFLVVMTIMFLAYSIASNLMYGWKLYSYRTLLDAAQTIVSLQLGIFNYEEVLNYNPVLGAFLIGSCIVFMTFVVLNLFISVILVAFSQEQIHHKVKEIVDLMLIKFCNMFGLKSLSSNLEAISSSP
uniref:Polycystic kidney disease 1 like 2a n=1 Tax=Xiphophorus couchianus TaxID=32473 RepID=A0A3B5LZZ0_9TELE